MYLKEIGKATGTGTTITFIPDKEILETLDFDYQTIIDHEKLQNVVLVGISLGGMAILTYENEFGHGTEKLVLMGTTPSNPLKYGQLHYLSEVLTPLYHLFAHTIAYIGSKFNQRKWPYLDYSEFGHHNALTIVYHDLKASPFYSYFWSVVSMFKYDISDSLHTITKPTLLLVGGKDFVVSPKASYDMAKLLLKGKVKTITEADHLIPMRFPNEMNKLILEFITSKKK